MSVSVEFLNVSAGYQKDTVLKDIGISFEKGKLTAIAGPNGTGKSTLLKLLVKQLTGYTGDVFINSKNIKSLSQKKLSNEVSMIGQNSGCDWEFSVSDVVSFGRYGSESVPLSVSRALEITGISYLSDKKVTEISGGEYQLAMISRAICQNSPVVLLDEPTSNLDPSFQIRIMNILKYLAKEGKTVICIMHDLNSILQWFDNCVLMKNGKVVNYGPVDKIITADEISRLYSVSCRLVETEGRKLLLY